MKKLVAMLLLIVVLISSSGLTVFAYKNSLKIPKEEPGIGDPYILKYNGIYYLYAVPGGITSCWSSKNLVEWKYEGKVMLKGGEKNIYECIFAPEVYYYAGSFYMYGAPNGKGHYIFKSDSPTGPFSVISDNIGKQFDGSIFTNNDNKRYFVYCGWNGINLSHLDGISSFVGETNNISVSIAGKWTEGPTLFKRNGKYYLTYTGNSVKLANYRVEYAYSDSPDSGFVKPKENTILLRTQGNITGLGHNGIVVGPDLDTYYISYHDTATDGRHINLDRILWNGNKLCVQGPTIHEVNNPDMPDFAVWFKENDTSKFETNTSWSYNNGYISTGKSEKATLLSKKKTELAYSAEFNIGFTDNNGCASAVFAYQDENNYGHCYIDQASKSFVTEYILSGQIQWHESSSLNTDFAYNVPHTVKVQQTSDTLHTYLDDTERCVKAEKTKAGKIGYIAENSDLICGYTAFSGKALGSKDYLAEKVIPGKNEAVHANNLTTLTQTTASYNCDGNAISLKKGQYLSYSMNVAETKNYNVDIVASKVTPNTKISIVAENEVKASVSLSNSDIKDNYQTFSIRNIPLSKGKTQLKIYVAEGSAEIYQVNTENAGKTEKLSFDCKSAADAKKILTGYESQPSYTNGRLCYNTMTGTGKILTNESGWGDYSIEADVNFKKGDSAGFLVRANSYFSHGVTEDLYEHQGYYISLSNKGIELQKHNNSLSTVLTHVNKGLQKGADYHIKVTCIGTLITLYVDDKEILSYNDTDEPYTIGASGLRVEHAAAEYDNLIITPINNALEQVNVDIPNSIIGKKQTTSDSISNNSNRTIIIVVSGLAISLLVVFIVLIIIRKKKCNGGVK